MKTKLLTVLILTSFLGISGCEAPTGDVGPQGATGATGEKGEKGPTGDKGAFSGIVSAWTEIKPAQWKLTGTKAVFSIADANFTQANLDGALLLAFYRPLPEDESSAVITLSDDTYGYFFSFKAVAGSIDYEVSFKHPNLINPNMEDWNIKVRYIIVPQAKAGRLKGANWRDYNEVKRILNLND
jgi:hypothetical protein